MMDSLPTPTVDVSPADRDAIVAGLVAYNSEQGFPWPWLDLNFVLRDADGTVIGGLLGETNAGWLFIKALWVAEPHRNRGHGRAILVAAEQEAVKRHCLGVYLDTYSFQARPFYERQGYTVFGILPDHPPGGAKFYLARRFTDPRPSAA